MHTTIANDDTASDFPELVLAMLVPHVVDFGMDF